MVDVSDKPETVRTAVAEARIRLTPRVVRALRRPGRSGKGDPLAVSIVAGIQAAKKTHDLIPLCHPIRIESIHIDPVRSGRTLSFRVTCRTRDRTGIEMEALTGAALAALAFYDMVKSVDRGLVIDRIRLLRKSGGKSGPFAAK